jgi:DNA-binding transcriptional LysR family regulator
MPILGRFLGERTLVSARVLLVDRLVDLVGEGVDLAVRLARLPDSTLTAVRLGDIRMLVCASPVYLDRAGVPEHPQDLGRHECIGLNAEGDGELWRFRSTNDDGGRVRSVRVPTRLSLNNVAAALDTALGGYGLVQAKAYQVEADLAAGRLVPVLGDFEPPPEPVHVVFHPDRGRHAPVRAFIDQAVPALRTELSRISSVLTRHGRA